ncbi:cation:proton antiporter [Limnoraphis robusta Tam1]|uniref:cation:proton antiporter n=1 Tax=Limnoraphis robusta TaxID=1118279 RepID=UPI002B1FEB8A|nr:cation:proton antiporter [Limnoraphis robusta]MEA5540948.1 cation:proton antiporter [Limnoraphis robusta Tam1]
MPTMQLLNWLPNSPIVIFTILLLVSLTLPPWFERLRLPGLVGLLLAGVVLGEHGLGVLDSQSETMKLLSDIGKIYLMFVAGLEIDLAQFKSKKDRAIGFGISTFIFPMLAGIAIGLWFGFGWNAAILIGSLLASHTLLAYPIVQRLGLIDTEPIIISVGATIFTSISALLVLAICVSVQAGEFSLYSLSWQLGSLAIYSAVVLFGFDWAGKAYFKRNGSEEGNQFLFVLLSVFLASVGAQIIQIDQIVGAFLAGLAVNDAVGNSLVKDKVEFVGSVLFIPFFFIAMGLFLNVPVFISTLTTNFTLPLAIVLGLIISKFIAAWAVKLLYGYSRDETLLIWSLSIPQVATTLAAALVGFNVGLLSEEVFNSVIVLMLATSILGPLLTQKYAPRLLPLKAAKSSFNINPTIKGGENSQEAEKTLPFTVVVPIYNPDTQRYLMEMAALVARHEEGSIVPLAIATHAQVHMDEPEFQKALKQSRLLLKRSEEVGQEFNVKTEPVLRIDGDVATGITRTACEKDASLIVMGWSENTSLRARLFGTVIDSVFWSSHCPVAVMRLLQEPVEIRQILVLVKTIAPRTIRTIRFAQLLASTNKAAVTLLHICPAQTSPQQIAIMETQLTEILSVEGSSINSNIVVRATNDVVGTILEQAKGFDLVVLRSQRRRTAGGLAVSSVTHEVMQNLRCSVVMFGEPQV